MNRIDHERQMALLVIIYFHGTDVALKIIFIDPMEISQSRTYCITKYSNFIMKYFLFEIKRNHLP
jgi:uncharacterized membrane protein